MVRTMKAVLRASGRPTCSRGGRRGTTGAARLGQPHPWGLDPKPHPACCLHLLRPPVVISHAGARQPGHRCLIPEHDLEITAGWGWRWRCRGERGIITAWTSTKVKGLLFFSRSWNGAQQMLRSPTFPGDGVSHMPWEKNTEFFDSSCLCVCTTRSCPSGSRVISECDGHPARPGFRTTTACLVEAGLAPSPWRAASWDTGSPGSILEDSSALCLQLLRTESCQKYWKLFKLWTYW